MDEFLSFFQWPQDTLRRPLKSFDHVVRVNGLSFTRKDPVLRKVRVFIHTFNFVDSGVGRFGTYWLVSHSDRNPKKDRNTGQRLRIRRTGTLGTTDDVGVGLGDWDITRVLGSGDHETWRSNTRNEERRGEMMKILPSGHRLWEFCDRWDEDKTDGQTRGQQRICRDSGWLTNLMVDKRRCGKSIIEQEGHFDFNKHFGHLILPILDSPKPVSFRTPV